MVNVSQLMNIDHHGDYELMHQSIQHYKYLHWLFGKMVLSVYPLSKLLSKSTKPVKKALGLASESRPSLSTQRTFRPSFKQNLILKIHDQTDFEFNSFTMITIISITQT